MSFAEELREEVARIIDQADLSGAVAQAKYQRAAAIRPIVEDAVNRAYDLIAGTVSVATSAKSLRISSKTLN